MRLCHRYAYIPLKIAIIAMNQLFTDKKKRKELFDPDAEIRPGRPRPDKPRSRLPLKVGMVETAALERGGDLLPGSVHFNPTPTKPGGAEAHGVWQIPLEHSTFGGERPHRI